MSVVLDDKDMFKQVIESAEPREILKKLLSKKKWSDMHKRLFLSALNINPSTCTVKYCFSYTPFKRNEMKDDTFLFLDKEYRIMGMLRGSTWNKDWEKIEDYYAQTSNYFSSLTVKKTRKDLTSKAFHILRFPHDTQLTKPIQDIDHSHKGVAYSKGRQLRLEQEEHEKNKDVRLNDYKIKKYSHITFQGMKQLCSDLMVYVSQHIHREDDIENISKKVKHRHVASKFYYYRELKLIDVLSYIASKYSDMIRFYEEKDEERYNDCKIKLIDLKNCFLGKQ